MVHDQLMQQGNSNFRKMPYNGLEVAEFASRLLRQDLQVGTGRGSRDGRTLVRLTSLLSPHQEPHRVYLFWGGHPSVTATRSPPCRPCCRNRRTCRLRCALGAAVFQTRRLESPRHVDADAAAYQKALLHSVSKQITERHDPLPPRAFHSSSLSSSTLHPQQGSATC